MKRKKNQNKRNNCLFTIATILLLFIFSVSVFMVGKELIQSKKEQDAFKDLTTIVEQSNNKHDNANTNIEELKPNYDELYTMNNDFIGWLSIPNTKVDYPVMYTPNEPEYYLRRGFDKTYFQSGTPFIGENCTIDSDCLIIYGHNMKNGSMFAQLKKFSSNSDTYEKSKYFWIFTPEKNYRYEIISAYTTGAKSDTYTLFKGPGEEFQEYLKKIRGYSEIQTDAGDLTVKDKIVTLSTCTGNQATRYVVQGKRVDALDVTQ